jgi:hypothetical protein
MPEKYQNLPVKTMHSLAFRRIIVRMIRHTVVFRLRHPAGSAAERDFLHAASTLARIPGVGRFECLRQVGTRNAFTFGLSMEFVDAAAYQAYNEHPGHARFVQERWLPEVEEFLEIDYTPWEVSPHP